MREAILISKKVCYACGSNKTAKNGSGGLCWHPNYPTDLVTCHKCFNTIFYSRNPKNQQRSREYGRRNFHYGNRIIYGNDRRYLTGYCSECNNNIYDKSCRLTQMHHWVYIPICPLFGREELCASCHSKQRWKIMRSLRLTKLESEVLYDYRAI